MKKSKLLILGLIALLLTGGLVLASCSTACDQGCKREKSACSSTCKGSGGLFGVLNCGDACGFDDKINSKDKDYNY
jgi:hypothetical protein